MSYIGVVAPPRKFTAEQEAAGDEFNESLTRLVDGLRGKEAQLTVFNMIGQADILALPAARRWLANIRSSTEDAVKTLRKADANGVPFYMRQPRSAATSMEKLQKLNNDELRTFEDSLFSTSILGSAVQFIGGLIEKVVSLALKLVRKLAEAAFEAAKNAISGDIVTALAVALLGGGFLYLKFRR